MRIQDSLIGSWRVVRVIDAGEELPREDEDEHFLWFTDDVIVTGNADAAWDMPYELKGESFPVAVDITREDRQEPWTDLGIVEVTADTLQLCMAGSSTQKRPDAFQSTAANGRMLYTATRCQEPLPD